MRTEPIFSDHFWDRIRGSWQKLLRISIDTSTKMETAKKVWRRKVVALSPLGLFLIAFITIITSYQATFEHGILDFLGGRVKTPPISLLMFAGPGKRIGQIGFGLVSILGCGCLPTFFSGLESATDQASGTIILLLRGSVLIAFSCLAVVGLLPLQEDIDLVITKKHPISWQSIIHQFAAALFFLFSIIIPHLWTRVFKVSFVKIFPLII